MYIVVLRLLIAIPLLLFTSVYAEDFQAELLPSKINPGDAFTIKVRGITSEAPSAVLKGSTLYFSPCGKDCFIAIGAVGIETEPGVCTIQVNVDERKKELNLVVSPAVFPEISLTLPEEKVFPSPENLKRSKREAEKLKSLWRTISDKFWEGDFILPLGNKFSTVFGVKRIINKKKISLHRGVDIKGENGDEVKASNRGRVVLAEELFFGGNTIILDHGLGIFTIYMHLSGFNVKPGNVVSKSDVIGFVGSSGRATGPHLHFGVKVFNISVNPGSLMLLDL